MADKANFNFDLSKYKQSKSILKVMTLVSGDALVERYISFKLKLGFHWHDGRDGD